MLRVKKNLLVLVLICSLILTGCSFGTKGNVWLVGTTAPDEKSKGRIGDMYLNTETFDLYQLSKSG